MPLCVGGPGFGHIPRCSSVEGSGLEARNPQTDYLAHQHSYHLRSTVCQSLSGIVSTVCFKSTYLPCGVACSETAHFRSDQATAGAGRSCPCLNRPWPFAQPSCQGSSSDPCPWCYRCCNTLDKAGMLCYHLKSVRAVVHGGCPLEVVWRNAVGHVAHIHHVLVLLGVHLASHHHALATLVVRRLGHAL
jgi:hypothetical protein